MKKKTVKAAPKKVTKAAPKKTLSKKVVKAAPKKMVKAAPVKAKNAPAKKIAPIAIKAAKRKPVSIRMLATDIEAIKIKAAKLGVPYQTYINILIHRDVVNA